MPFKVKDSGLKMITEKYSHLLPAPCMVADYLNRPTQPTMCTSVACMSGQRKDKRWQEFERKVDSIDHITKDAETILGDAK